jgi:hypothetical protein
MRGDLINELKGAWLGGATSAASRGVRGDAAPGSGLSGVAMRHIVSIMLENEPGALSRVAGLFSARGYNIESLTVSATEDASL